MNGTLEGVELHPPHVLNVATLPNLPCKIRNTENVILQRDITNDSCIICIIASSNRPGSSCALNLLIWGVMQ